MAAEDALTFFLDPGPGGFDDAFMDVLAATDEIHRSLISKVANDVVGLMARTVTQDTGELSRQMQIIDMEEVGERGSKYTIGSTAVNRSGREYAYFEHMRHQGTSFFDKGERYANDTLFGGAAAIINSID